MSTPGLNSWVSSLLQTHGPEPWILEYDTATTCGYRAHKNFVFALWLTIVVKIETKPESLTRLSEGIYIPESEYTSHGTKWFEKRPVAR